MILLVILFSGLGSASLGISPAIVKMDFAPSEMREIDYIVFSDHPDKKISIFASGDLAPYVTFDKVEVTGQNSFKAIINFPKDIEIPGEHRIDIVVKEKPDEDQFIGTAIEIHAALKIFVPYPGRYVEATLSVPDGNIDEAIPIEAHVFNRGQDSLNLNFNMNFYTDGGKLVSNIPFTPVTLEPLQDKYFRNYLNTSDFKPGNYFAEGIADYGEIVKVNKTFRIGSLFVNITNFTNVVAKGKIQKFYVNVESLWNGDLNEVYADVNISNSSYSYDFRTPSITLKAWTSDILTGFLDTESLNGKYDSKITLSYAGQKTNVLGSLLVIAGLNTAYIYIGLAGILLIIIIVVAILRIKRSRLSFSKLVSSRFKGRGER